MKIDIGTLHIAASALSVLQTVVLSCQYVTVRQARGMRYWVVWGLLAAAGTLLNLCPVSSPFARVPIVAASWMLCAALGFLYAGILDFLGRPIPWLRLGAILLAFSVFSATRPGGRDDALRQLALYAAGAWASIAGVVALRRDSPAAIRQSASFVSAVLSFQFILFLLGAILPVLYRRLPGIPLPPTALAAFALLPPCISILLAFGAIMLMHQKSNAEHLEAQSNMHLVFDTHPDAIWITCLEDGKIVEVNEGFTSFTGMRRDDVLGKTSLELPLWKDPDDRRRIVDMARELGSVKDREIEFRFQDGRQGIGTLSARYFSLHGLPHLINVIHDITERKRMEMSLRESEEKFRLLVENSNDIIYTLSTTGIIEFVSPVCKTLLGHEVSEIEGRSIGDFVHPDDILSFFSFFNSVMATGRSGPEIEYRMRHKNGSWVWHSSSGVPLRDEKGMVSGFYGISRDVSGQKRLEDELHLQATTDELTRTHNRRDFISIATLEIRRALRLGHPLSLALIDMDEFKLINDSWGHAGGDRALVFFSKTCQENIREIDILSRVGGDEFTVLMPETDIDQAYDILSRVRAAVAAERFSVDDHEASITVSVGISTLRGADDHLDSLLSRADKALYHSKTAGRNHVSLER